MAFRSTLAVLNGGGRDRSILDAAIVLAKPAGGRILGLHVRPDPRTAVPIVGEGMSSVVVTDLMETVDREGKARAAQAELDFKTWCTARNVPQVPVDSPITALSAGWQVRVGQADSEIARVGRLVDVIVTGRPSTDYDERSAVVESALFDSGRPVLCAAPETKEDFGARIAILWNGSAQAARALGDAAVLVGQAEAVAVIAHDRPVDEGPGAEDLAAELVRRGVKAVVRQVDGAGSTDAIDQAIGDFNADLIVMGAYTHSRLRQMVLGGVTRHMLTSARVPLFMAH